MGVHPPGYGQRIVYNGHIGHKRIAERVNSESVEINAFSGEKTAKNCRDKMNNLNKKYKTVKDKSKSTGEGRDKTKSFPNDSRS